MTTLRRAVHFTASVALLGAVLFTTAVMGGSYGGIVTAEALRLRSDPNVTSPILALVSPSDEAPVNTAQMEEWYNILFRDQDDFLSNYYEGAEIPEEPLLAYINTGGSVLNLRSGPGTTYAIVDTIPGGSLLTVLSGGDGWYEVRYKEDGSAFISGEYVLLMTQEEYDDYVESASYRGEQIAQYALNYLGCKYVYGGNGPSTFDCSGFVKYIYAQFGYTLNRTATDQLDNGISVEMDELQAGDLVFFRSSGTVKPVSHVGMYIGDGQFVHASTNQYVVRIDDLDSGYYSNIYVYGRRIV